MEARLMIMGMSMSDGLQWALSDAPDVPFFDGIDR
jgi:hypothetical protein